MVQSIGLSKEFGIGTSRWSQLATGISQNVLGTLGLFQLPSCETNHISGVRQPFIMPIDPDGMELTQDTVGTTMSTMSRVLENSKVRGWNHLKLHSFTCLAIDPACQLEALVSFHVFSPHGLVWAPSQGGD